MLFWKSTNLRKLIKDHFFKRNTCFCMWYLSLFTTYIKITVNTIKVTLTFLILYNSFMKNVDKYIFRNITGFKKKNQMCILLANVWTMCGMVKYLLPISTNFEIVSYKNQIFTNHCIKDAYNFNLHFSHHCSLVVYL